MSAKVPIDIPVLFEASVSNLDPTDFNQVLKLLFEVSEVELIPTLYRKAYRAFEKLIPCDYIHFTVHRFRPDMSAVKIDACKGPKFLPEQYAYYSRHALEHPVARHFSETGNGAAIRISDLVPTEDWIATRFWQKTLAQHDFRYSMIAVWPVGRNATLVLSFDRRREDFTDREKNLLNLIFPFIGRQFQRLKRPRNRPSSRRHAQVQAADSNAGHHLDTDLNLLTPREQEVMNWLGEGKSNTEIALILEIRPRTAQKHVENILRKLNLENRYVAAAIAASNRNL